MRDDISDLYIGPADRRVLRTACDFVAPRLRTNHESPPVIDLGPRQVLLESGAYKAFVNAS